MSQQVNLFNPIFLKQKKVFTAAHMVQTLGLVLVGGLLLTAYGAYKTRALAQQAEAGKATLAVHQARLARVTAEFPPREKSAELEADVVRKRAELAALREVSGVLEGGDLGNTSGYSEYFRALARQNVPGLWLTRVHIAGAGKDIGVVGKAMQPELVPGYLQRLTREAVLQGKTFGTLEIGQAGPAAPAALAGRAPGAAVAVPPYVEFRLLTQPAEASK